MNDIAADILKANSYCVLATVCKNGAPWAVPVHFVYDSQNIYWLSQDETVHSENIMRDGRVFFVIYDSHQSGAPGERGAVYISTRAIKLSGDEAMMARDIYADRYPDENERKLVEWSVYCAPIGVVNKAKSIAQMIYYYPGATEESND